MYRLNNGYSIRDWIWRTSRKEHNCLKCDNKIRTGNKYLWIRLNRGGGILGPIRFCGDCGDTLFDLCKSLTEWVNRRDAIDTEAD